MKKFNHCIQHLITQHTNLGSLIAKALQSDQTKNLVTHALSAKLQTLISDTHVADGIVSFLCSTAEKATLVRFESIDLLSTLRQHPKLGHIKKIQVRVVPTFAQTPNQSNHFTTGNKPKALENATENNNQINKISRLTADQLGMIAENLSAQPGSQELKESLLKLARRV
jgi:hypothetical protein